MRLNIEWMAPWRFGGPWKLYGYHLINNSLGTKGIWVLGLCVTFTNAESTHGVGLSIIL